MMNHYNKTLLLLGILLVTFILYNRLFKIRLPREFIDILFLIKRSIFITMLILLTINIIMLYKYYCKKENKKTPKFMIFLKSLYENPANPIIIAKNSMIELDAMIKSHAPDYDKHESYSDYIITKIAQIFFNSKEKIITIILIFRILPQIIVCSSFIIDVFYMHKFVYFYKSLWVLIFPLIITYLTYSINTNVSSNLDEINNTLVFKVIHKKDMTNNTTLNDMNTITVYDWQQILLAEDSDLYYCAHILSEETRQFFNDDKISATYTLNYCVDLITILFRIDYYMKLYDNMKSILEIPCNIIRYLIFTTLWLYIIIQ